VAVFLLDANVLLALSWPTHLHHDHAQNWLETHARSGWASCPFTQAAFIRLSSNPVVSPEAIPPSKAQILLDISLKHPHHHFWPDELSVRDAIAPLRSNVVGHRQITDAYLLGLAIFRKGKLATFDRAIASLVPEGVATNSVLELL
jgi:toxin-antitoxin system PIN domain toxin